MRFDRVTARAGLAVFVSAVVAGCSISPDEDSPKVAYEDAESSKPLEVPPDLTTPERRDAVEVPDEDVVASSESQAGGAATGSNQASTEGPLLPQTEGIRFVRGQDTAWIEIDDVPAEEIWSQLQGFIESQGLSIANKRPELGIVETPWFERGNTPEKGGVTGFLSNLLSGIESSTKRHKYQFSLERADGGTRIFVEHRRLEEVADERDPKQVDTFSWKPQGGVPAVENEMRKRLLVYLGVSRQRAEGVISDAEAEAILGGEAVLRVEAEGAVSIRVDDSDFRRVFAQVGRALERIGAKTESASRGERRYRIEWTPPPSAADGADEPQSLQVKLKRREERVDIVAANADGDRRNGPVHRALLEELVEAMGGRSSTAGEGQSVPTPASDGGEEAAQPSGGTTGQDSDEDFEDADGDGLPDDIPGN